MKIALAQIRVLPNEPSKNLTKMLDFIETVQGKADIIVFPEMCVSGYLVGDKWCDDSYCYDIMSYNSMIEEWSKIYNITIIWGSIFIDNDLKNEDGRLRKYNTAFISRNGNTSMRFKTLLPNYREFDDKRYFYSEPHKIKPYPFMKDGTVYPIGIEVCEDLWCSDYSINPSSVLNKFGNIECIINISASPFSVNKSEARDHAIKKIYDNMVGKVPFLYVNCVGVQNNGKNFITFDGDSRVYDETGKKLDASIEEYQEDIIYVEIENKKVVKASTIKKVPYCKRLPIYQKRDAIIESLRYLHNLLGKKFIIGLSGGVDSALSAILAVVAVGNKNVIAYNLPSEYNSNETKTIASELAKNLGIEYRSVPIKSILKGTQKTFNSNSSLVWENVQAKIRGLILTTEAQINDAVVISNGNKVEVATGYCTLYGDTVGAISPLGDLTKMEIFDLVKSFHIVALDKLIPDDDLNFELAPSAELKEKQKDPFCWGLDDYIIEQIMNYNKKSLYNILYDFCNGTNPLYDKYFPNKDVKGFTDHLEWLVKLMENSVFKRIQMPPITILSKSAYGYDYRESQLPVLFTRKYMDYKKELLGEN
jgi:NAD+ synthase (glutamine-hydrolysing)